MPEKPNSPNTLHVYQREVSQTERSSLSVLAGMIQPGSSVLDLGLGSGALGKHLSALGWPAPDGLTYNPEEAQIARPFYGRVEVADLEDADLPTLFKGQRYNYIICADVLEHLRNPRQVLDACQQLLAKDGRLLISVPNVAYVGLLGELMCGEFEYRTEGLLDNTHLRFFTRRSLLRFLKDAGWQALALETVERDLPDSEFKADFVRLPPSVSRHLLTLPDALTYQFIVSATVANANDVSQPLRTVDPNEGSMEGATFSLQLYLGSPKGYSEERKLLARGQIGQEHQRLAFVLPNDGQPITSLRLDPADRPGFLRWHGLSLHAVNGDLLWRWSAENDGVEPLLNCPSNELVLRTPWTVAHGVTSLLLGSDPFIELPLQRELEKLGRSAAGCVLEVELGWPMSADYLALLPIVKPLRQRAERLEQQWKHSHEEAQSTIQALMHEATEAANLQRSLQESAILKEKQYAQLSEANAKHHEEEIAAQAQRFAELLSKNNMMEHQQARLQQEFDALAAHLRWLESSTVFRITRPIVHFKMKMDRLLGRAPPATPPHSGEVDSTAPLLLSSTRLNESRMVDVIVPVYRGLEDTQRCVMSVLASDVGVPFRLVIINDASPEVEVTDWLRQIQASHPATIELLENPDNLGFVGTVNRGMALHPDRDVLLLNSDTEVANDWLDRLQRAAYSDARVASVTPFSNNATICSYPAFCKDNELPAGLDTKALDQHFAKANPGQVVDVPTGVGFCMYIRRDALDAVGLFDTENFGKGYGEENDFCCRAFDAGWRNLHALDTFVRHAGGVSFGASKSQRELAAMETLRRLHPSYEPRVHAFVAQDPARLARIKADLMRLRDSGLPVVLAVLHDRAGGTRRHPGELAAHLSTQAAFLLLAPLPGERVGLRLLDAPEEHALVFRLPEQLPSLLFALRALGVAHIHYHHLIGHQPAVLDLPAQLGLAYDFTAHDFYSYCPQISLTDHKNRYCGEEGLDQCRTCLKRSPAPDGVDIESWRNKYGHFLRGARHVLAPSRDAARRIHLFVPQADVRIAPHTDLPDLKALPSPQPLPLAKDAALKVAVIGALSPIKGADLLEAAALQASRNNAPVEFHLIGYAYRHLSTQPRAKLTVHGQYEEADLPALLSWLKPDLVWFPALWPETYSYTLSACLQAGLPVVAPNLGAFHERLQGRAWSWLQPWDATAEEFLAFFNQIREQNFVVGQKPALALPIAISAVDENIRLWDYRHDYMRGIAPLVGTGDLSDEFLQAQQSTGDPGLAGAVQGVKRWLLPAIGRLRSSRWLGPVARAIPLRWQTRLKSWLRR
jgi:O-antigen biosynthesis protein